MVMHLQRGFNLAGPQASEVWVDIKQSTVHGVRFWPTLYPSTDAQYRISPTAIRFPTRMLIKLRSISELQ